METNMPPPGASDAPSAQPPALPPSPEPAPAPIAGFWRRFGAFVIDALVLGAIGLGIGLVFGPALSRMGGWERLIGFAIVLAYAGLLNSRLGGGRTLGKRALGIRVIGLDGALLSVPRTLLRQTVFAVPSFLNGAPFPEHVLMGPAGIILSVVLFGGLFGIAYLAVFNRPSRRALHDLVAGSYVVRTTAPVAVPAPPTWRGHLIIVGVVFVVAGLLPLAAKRLVGTAFFEDLMPLYRGMSAEPGVMAATASVGKRYGTGGDSEFVTITLTLDRGPVDDEARARRVARRALGLYPAARDKDAIDIVFVHGYNMVIASSFRSQGFRFTPEDLAQPE